MASLRLSLLGPFQAFLDGKPVTSFDSHKARALLAYLAVESGRPHSREALAGLIWPDQPQASAMDNLRNVLARLRGAIGDRQARPPFLLITHPLIQFNRDSDCCVDVWELENQVACNSQQLAISYQLSALSDQQSQIENLKSAITLYRGEFLEGFSLSGSPEFEEWVLAKRQHFRNLALELLRFLAEQAGQAHAYKQALAYQRRILELEPWDEPAHRRVMLLLALSGQRSAALAQYQVCRKALKAELGVDPAEETTRLHEQICDGSVMPSPGPPAFFTLEIPPAPPPLFVSRQPELKQLDEALHRALAGKGQAIFVTGGPGCGKTALVQEFLRRALSAHPGLAAISGNCQAYFGQGDPYLPFRETLEMLTGQVEDRYEAGMIGQEHARRLWQLSGFAIQTLVEEGPALVETFLPGKFLLKQAYRAMRDTPGWLGQLQAIVRYRRQPQSIAQAEQEALLFQYSNVLRTFAGHVPLVIFLDDLQWADPGSLSLLFTLGRRIAGSRILLVGAFRPEEVLDDSGEEQHPLTKLYQEIQIVYGNPPVDLDRLEDRSFIHALLDHQPNRLGSAFRDRLYQQTLGHPLFTIELLRGMQQRGEITQNPAGEWEETAALDWEALPPRVEAAIGERIGRLPKDLRNILEIASVEGEGFTAEVIAEIQEASLKHILASLSEQLDRQHHLVRAESFNRRDGYGLSRYRFCHILFQRYLYHSLDPVRRAGLHERVGLALERLYGEENEAVSGQLARHFEEARLPRKAAETLYRAGCRAARLSAYAEAATCFSHALELLPAGELAPQFKLLLERCQVYHRTAQRKGEEQDALALEALAGDLEPAQKVQAVLARARSLQYIDRPVEFIETARRAVALAQAAGRVDLQAEAYRLLSAYMTPLPFPEIKAASEQALALARQAGLKSLEAEILWNFARTTRKKEGNSSPEQAGQALEIYRSTGDRNGEAQALLALSQIYSDRKMYDKALPYAEQSYRFFLEVGNRYDALWSLLFLVTAHINFGSLDRMEEPLQQAVELARNIGQLKAELFPTHFLTILHWLRGDIEKAFLYAQQVCDLIDRRKRGASQDDLELNEYGFWEGIGLLFRGIVQEKLGFLEQAFSDYQRGAITFFKDEEADYYFPLPVMGMARLALERGEPIQALAYVDEYLPCLARLHMVDVDYLHFWAYLTAYEVLQACEDRRAWSVLQEAYQRLQERAALIEDEAMRGKFLASFPWYSQIINLWSQLD